MRRRSVLAIGCGIAGAIAQAVGAQPRPSAGVIDGVVTDANLTSLGDATASILGSTIKVVTGANGRFRIVGVPAGNYFLVVQRLGFAPSSLTLQVAPSDTLRMSFALERVMSPLDTVVISGKRLGMRLAGFESRRKAGFGQFMTQEEIDKRNVVYAGDLLRSFMAVRLALAKSGDRIAVSLRSGCRYEVFLDGVALPAPVNVDNLPSPRDLAGIEIYAGPAQTPIEFKSTRGGFCGAILVWTKDGS